MSIELKPNSLKQVCFFLKYKKELMDLENKKPITLNLNLKNRIESLLNPKFEKNFSSDCHTTALYLAGFFKTENSKASPKSKSKNILLPEIISFLEQKQPKIDSLEPENRAKLIFYFNENKYCKHTRFIYGENLENTIDRAGVGGEIFHFYNPLGFIGPEYFSEDKKEILVNLNIKQN